MQQSAFLILTHQLDPQSRALIARAKDQLKGLCDVHVVGYFDDPDLAPPEFAQDPAYHAFGPNDLRHAEYPLKGKRQPFKLLPGNGDLMILKFARRNPVYQQIWGYEYDVEFTGPLSVLIGAFADSEADLLGTNLGPPHYAWQHDNMTSIPDGWPDAQDDVERGFFPLFRVSRRLLTEMDKFYRASGDGHYEWSWPYVARARGLVIEDVGGDGPYVAPGNTNRFYTSSPDRRDLYPGTFRYRPAQAQPGRRPNTLYHPIKAQPVPTPDFLRYRVKYLARLIRGKK